MNVNQMPVGYPALLILFAALALFLILLAAKSRGAADQGESKRSRRSILGIVIQMLGFAAVGVGRVDISLPPVSRAALIDAAIVLLLTVVTCGLFFASKRAMGRNWSLVARTRSNHDLVTWGPFAYVRHPIYTALFAWLVAMAVAFGHEYGLIVGIPLLAVGTGLRVVEEEKLLRVHFGAAYEAYAARVKRFLPGLF